MHKVGRLCERCQAKGIITPARVVHHVKPISDSNINNPEITLAESNLMALCQDCHAEIHKGEHRAPKRWIAMADGSVRVME